MLSSFSDILNNLISKGETMLNSFESKHSALVTILDNLSHALDDPVKASVDQMTNFPPWREIFSEIRFKNRHLLPDFDCLENKELQDGINSLDKVKALINQEAGGHTHPEDRVDRDEMESNDPPRIDDCRSKLSNQAPQDLVPPHPSLCSGRKRHRGGRKRRRNRVRRKRHRSDFPESQESSS